MLTKKEQARYRAITQQLSRLSRNGWDRATHVDYEPLEKELKALADKMVLPVLNKKKEKYIVALALSSLDELYTEKGDAEEYADSDSTAEREHCKQVSKLIDAIAEFRFGKGVWHERQL